MAIEDNGILPFLGIKTLCRALRILTKVYAKLTIRIFYIATLVYHTCLGNSYTRSLLILNVDEKFHRNCHILKESSDKSNQHVSDSFLINNEIESITLSFANALNDETLPLSINFSKFLILIISSLLFSF